jgi:hypothetical protein
VFGSTPIAAVLGAAPAPSSDPADLRPFVRQACAAGLAVMLVAPGTKIPVDGRSSVQKRKDDKAAQDEAQAAGNPRYLSAKSPNGLHLATTDSATAVKYLNAAAKLYPDPLNFAIEVGRSKLILVDVDTPEEKDAFLNWWSQAEGRDMRSVAPTVSSPGVYDQQTQQWIHWGGGHYYFTLPEGVELDDTTGNYTHTTPGGKFSVAWAHRYVLIPPSVRPEGAYRFTGMDMAAPPALLELVRGRAAHAAENRARAAERRDADGGEFVDAIDAWAESVEWSDVLSPHDWVPTLDTDRCGCPVWTAPGFHGTPKSATAHDGGCDLGRYTTTNAPLHVWTDHTDPLLDAWLAEKNTKTVTKLQLIAIYEHGGDVSAACRALGLATLADTVATMLSDADLRIDAGAMANTLNTEWTLPTVEAQVPLAQGDTAPPATAAPSVDPTPAPEPLDTYALFGNPSDEDHANGGDASHTDWAHRDGGYDRE